MNTGTANTNESSADKEGRAVAEGIALEEWKEMWDTGDPQTMFMSDKLRKFETKYYEQVVDGSGKAKIFFPLCGKDIHLKWYADQGHEIVGVEYSETACKGFFKDQGVVYEEEPAPGMGGKLFKSSDGNIRIYCGDFYEFSTSVEKDFDAVWDRGSFNALPKTDRSKYVAIMLSKGMLKPNCRYFVETFVGPEEEGYVTDDIIKEQFKVGTHFSFEKLEQEQFGLGPNGENTCPPESEGETMIVQLVLLRPLL